MAVQYLAANRFGLGRRWDDPAVDDPKVWLIRQLGAFDPNPAAFAVLAGREAIAAAYIDYREDRQTMRKEAADAAPMSDEEKGMDPELRKLSRSEIRRHYVEAASARLMPRRRWPARVNRQVIAHTLASALSSSRPSQGTRNTRSNPM